MSKVYLIGTAHQQYRQRDDRHVPAFSDEQEIVRYDRQRGKWFLEERAGGRTHITVGQGAALASQDNFTWNPGIPGCRAFDKLLRRLIRGPVTPTTEDIAWAAGFLEGEGSFFRNQGRPRVKAAQVNTEPLLRLERLFGGSINVENGTARRLNNPNRQPLSNWFLSGAEAEALMRLIRPQMSIRRQEVIDEALDRGSERWR